MTFSKLDEAIFISVFIKLLFVYILFSATVYVGFIQK